MSGTTLTIVEKPRVRLEKSMVWPETSKKKMKKKSVNSFVEKKKLELKMEIKFDMK